MSETHIAAHTCFAPALPHLPLGYKFDADHPMQLVPFTQFARILKPINICRKCYSYATTNFHLAVINQASAKHTVASPAAAALGGLTQFSGLVNSCMHPMFNELEPAILREGRRVAIILGHEARKGNAKRKPRLTYVVKYKICNDPRLSVAVRVTESKLRLYSDSVPLLNKYWYGDYPHSVNAPFVRSVLTRLTPFANSALWNKLPMDEAILMHFLHHKDMLHEWKAGMNMKNYQATRVDSA
jgi:hypothetical protein